MTNDEYRKLAAVFGRRGGLSRSAKKQAASRRNGKLGGRPRKNAKDTTKKQDRVVDTGSESDLHKS